MKALLAVLFALGMTAVIALAIFVIGVNAISNPNTVTMAGSPAVSKDPAVNVSNTTGVDAQQMIQLQEQVKTYQQREQQYKTELNDAAQKINQTNQQLQVYMQLVNELQRRGVISIGSDGVVTIGRGF